MNKITGLIACLILVGASYAVPASDIFGAHKVEKIQAPDRIQVMFNRLPISVRLGHIQAGPDAEPKLAELVNGKSVVLKFVEELGTHESGDPYVYVMAGNINVNVKLVELGVATYDTTVAKSKLFDTYFQRAQDQQDKNKQTATGATPATPKPTPTLTPTPTPAPAPAAGGGSICAELRGSFHHLPGCAKVQRLSANNKVFFATPELAEKSGKRPCWSCQPDRADEQAFGHKSANTNLAQKVGHLIGLKSNAKLFYTPTAPALNSADVNDMIGFATVDAATASGREPDTGSLRLTAPPGQPAVPPKQGECIGRSPPFFRPCFRAPADESGLCTVCQGLE